MWLLPLLLISLVGTLSGCMAPQPIHWADAYANGKRAEERKQALQTDSYSFEKAYAPYENRLRTAQPSAARPLPPPGMMPALPPVPEWLPIPTPPPPRPPDPSFILRTPSGKLYWGVGSTVWGPDGSYTVY